MDFLKALLEYPGLLDELLLVVDNAVLLPSWSSGLSVDHVQNEPSISVCHSLHLKTQLLKDFAFLTSSQSALDHLCISLICKYHF